MNASEKIKVLAGLDGFESIDMYLGRGPIPFTRSVLSGTQDGLGESDDCWGREILPIPNYLTSRDAIIPVIMKWCGDSIGRKILFITELDRIVPRDLRDCSQGIFIMLTASPEQLANALLIAAGLMKD